MTEPAPELDPGPVPEDPAEPASFAQLWDAFGPGERVSKGRYSIYKTPDGGMMIAYRPDGVDEDQHLPIPAPMVAMMVAASEGKGPLGRMKAMAMDRFG